LDNNNLHTLSAKILGQLSIMQAVVVGLPGEKSIFQFIQEGFYDIPGVKDVLVVGEACENIKSNKCKIVKIKRKDIHYADIKFTLSDKDEFDKYLPYIENFAVMLAIIFEEKRQKEINDELFEELRINQNQLHKTNIELQERNQETQQLNEELSASIEELEATNEELSATNDELALKNNLLDKKSLQLENAMKKLKETQMQLIQTEKMASIGTMVAGVAHELNNPLNFINGGLYSLQEKLNEIGKIDYFEDEIEFIREGVNRSTKIISNLNQFNNARITMCNIHKIIENCLGILLHQTKGKIEIEKNFNSTSIELKAVEEQLHQIFFNILINAIQAIPDKGKISVTTNVKPLLCEIIIIDSGTGISKDNLKNVFDPFFTTKDPGEGTGLGLSVAYNFVNDLKGTIEINSKLGEGTTVHITLPCNS